jgi:hypothetical protein
MLSFVAVLFLALCAAAIVLAGEARTGRLVGRTPGGTRARAVVFLLGSVAGGTLLVALSQREWLFILALAPITALSLIRFGMLAHGWWRGWRLSVYTALLLLAGILACLPWLPRPLDRATLIESFRGGRPTHVPDSISPDAGVPVRG